MLDPNKQAPVWEAETTASRANLCLSYLYVHGFMSKPTKDGIRRRIIKWRDKTPKPLCAENGGT